MPCPSRYLENGFIDIPGILKRSTVFTYLLGPRRTGKTYGIIQELTEHTHESKKPFIYLRRTRASLDTCMTADGNPFKDYDPSIQPFVRDKLLYFSHSHTDENTNKLVEDDVVAIAMALSEVGKFRGMSFDTDWIFAEEIIPQPLEPLRKNEGAAFLSLYDTINSNRGLLGLQEVRVIFAGNSDRLDAPILNFQGVDVIVENMLRRGQMEYISRETEVSVFLFGDSPIAMKRGKNTALYKSIQGSDYYNMAILNRFKDLDDQAELIKSCPLQEYVPYCMIGDLYIYKHKSNKTYYICNTPHDQGLTLRMTKDDKKRFLLKYGVLFDAYLAKRIYSSSYKNLTQLKDVLGL